MIALVTGATGFLGSYIIRQLLAEGQYTVVRAMHRSPATNEWLADIADRVEWHTADLNDIFALEQAMQGVQHVYHAAATVSFESNARKAMMRANIEGTANIVNAAMQCGVQKFGHISSVAALGRSKNKAMMDENTKWQTDPLNTGYSISKFYAEQEVWRAQAEGMDVVVVNPSIIIGAFDWRNASPALIKTVAKGLRVYTVGSTGFIDVRDVAKAIVNLVNSPISNERYVLNAENMTYKTFFDQTADALGVARPSIKVPVWLTEIVWRAEALRSYITGKRSLITKETAQTASHDFEYSSQKYHDAFPNHQFIPISKTIKDTTDIYKSKQVQVLR